MLEYAPTSLFGTVRPSDATFCVLGKNEAGVIGVLSWHDSEWCARRAAHEIRRNGGQAEFHPAPKADSNELSELIDRTVAGGFGRSGFLRVMGLE
jgi:hypothetical protein